MTRGRILRRIGRAYLWGLFVPFGMILGAIGMWRALRALERYADGIDLRASRLGAASVFVVASGAVVLAFVDPGLAVLAVALAVLIGDAGAIEYAKAMVSWSGVGPEPVRERWRRAQFLVGAAAGAILMGFGLAAAAPAGRVVMFAGLPLASRSPAGIAMVLGAIGLRLAMWFTLQSAQVLTRDRSRQAALDEFAVAPLQAAITEPPASTWSNPGSL